MILSTEPQTTIDYDVFGPQEKVKTSNITFVPSKELNNFIGSSIHICMYIEILHLEKHKNHIIHIIFISYSYHLYAKFIML